MTRTKLKRKVQYKDFIFEIDRMSHGMYGVRAFKNGRRIADSNGHHQYIGMGKGRQKAINDAIDTINKYGANW